MPAFTITRQGKGSFSAVAPDGRVLGIATLSAKLHGLPLQSGRNFLELAVEPPYRQQGIGGALYAAAVARAHRSWVDTLACAVTADDPAALAFAVRRGFRVEHRMMDGELDLQRFDPAPWAGAVAAAESRGIRFTTLLQAQDGRDTWKNLYELDRHCSWDVPDWSGVMPPFGEYCADLRQYDYAGSFLAWAGDELVGFSFTSVEVDGSGYTGFMGVSRAYRGQGIALALKLLTIQWAQERGLTRLGTNNNAANEPILGLNRKLGYELKEGTIYLVKDLEGPRTLLKETLKTAGTLVLFVVLYAWWKGWWAGVGLGAIIFVHEVGHMLAGRLRGIRTSFPLFIPFIGAFVSMKEEPASVFDRAVLTVGGPAAGILASATAWALGAALSNRMLVNVAYMGFSIHVLNMIPLPPLDGGWIIVAVSRWLLAVTAPAFLAFSFWQDLGGLAGALIPSTWRVLKERDKTEFYKVSLQRRGTALAAYITLTALALGGAWGTSRMLIGHFQLPWLEFRNYDGLSFGLWIAGIAVVVYLAYLGMARLGWFTPFTPADAEPVHADDER